VTAQPARRERNAHGLRVLKGKRLRKPSLAPWMIMVLIAIFAFLGLGFARTSLDRSAFDLAELDRAIDVQLAINEQLRLEVARLENPARIAPLADQMGLVLPSDTKQLLVNLDEPSAVVAEGDGSGANQ